MCEPASMIVTKTKVYWSEKTESHHEIIKEFNLKEQDTRGNYTLVPIEIIPPDENDFKAPLSKWEFRIDHAGYQRDLPDWWDAKKDEKRVRAELKKWRKAKVVMPKEKLDKVDINQIIAIYGTVKSICGSAQVKSICGSAQVKYIYDSAQVEYIYGSAQVKSICDSAQVESIYDSAQVEYIYDSAQVKSICDSAQVKSIYDSAQVEYICGSAQVKYIKGKAIVQSYNNLNPEILISSQAVLIDRTKDPVVCYVGK